jgi:hypothetical protein
MLLFTTFVTVAFEPTKASRSLSQRSIQTSQDIRMEIQERPPLYQGPNLDPTGVALYPRFLGIGTYALLANRIPCDKSGIVIGSRGSTGHRRWQ